MDRRHPFEVHLFGDSLTHSVVADRDDRVSDAARNRIRDGTEDGNAEELLTPALLIVVEVGRDSVIECDQDARDDDRVAAGAEDNNLTRLLHVSPLQMLQIT